MKKFFEFFLAFIFCSEIIISSNFIAIKIENTKTIHNLIDKLDKFKLKNSNFEMIPNNGYVFMMTKIFYRKKISTNQPLYILILRYPEKTSTENKKKLYNIFPFIYKLEFFFTEKVIYKKNNKIYYKNPNQNYFFLRTEKFIKFFEDWKINHLCPYFKSIIIDWKKSGILCKVVQNIEFIKIKPVLYKNIETRKFSLLIRNNKAYEGRLSGFPSYLLTTDFKTITPFESDENKIKKINALNSYINRFRLCFLLTTGIYNNIVYKEVLKNIGNIKNCISYYGIISDKNDNFFITNYNSSFSF
jgi:hypothetical protein